MTFVPGVFVCIFAPLALTADVLALRGLRLWKRSLLLPWLVLYAVIILLVMSVVLSGIFHRGFHWQYLLLAICSFCFLSAWRHVRYQVPVALKLSIGIHRKSVNTGVFYKHLQPQVLPNIS